MDRTEVDAALWTEATVGWSRETLLKDLTDSNSSAAICIFLFITYLIGKAKSQGEVESAGLRSAYILFSECNEYSVVGEAGKNYVTSKQR